MLICFVVVVECHWDFKKLGLISWLGLSIGTPLFLVTKRIFHTLLKMLTFRMLTFR